MCCFSQAVRYVSNTRIYARPTDGGRQLLVYSMKLAADSDVAMVLPVPVPIGSADDAVMFVDMSECPTFFTELDAFFPVEQSRGPAPQALSFGVPAPAPLVVHEVGDFEASFVPTRRDFSRLDPRFRLPEGVFDALPQYSDWGFCVFKLRSKSPPAPAEREPNLLSKITNVFRAAPEPSTAQPKDYHPMAFELPRRDPTTLFFPTVHVHDGQVHDVAHFDHTLYCQVDGGAPLEWERTGAPISMGGVAKAWVNNSELFRRRLSGQQPNRDVLIPT